MLETPRSFGPIGNQKDSSGYAGHVIGLTTQHLHTIWQYVGNRIDGKECARRLATSTCGTIGGIAIVHVLGNLSILLRASFARLRAMPWEATLRASSFHGWRACSKNDLKTVTSGPVKNWASRKILTASRSREPMQLFTQTRAVACRMRSFPRRRSPLSSSKHGGTSKTLGMMRMTEFEREILMRLRSWQWT